MPIAVGMIRTVVDRAGRLGVPVSMRKTRALNLVAWWFWMVEVKQMYVNDLLKMLHFAGLFL